MKQNRLLYISPSTIPSKSANSIHVMEICNEFSRLFSKVYLFADFNFNEKLESVFGFYGLPSGAFQICSYNFWLRNRIYKWWKINFLLLKTVHRINPSLVICRLNAAIVSLFFFPRRSNLILELHGPPRRVVGLLICLLGLLRPLKIVVISYELKKMISSTIKFIDIVVLHDGARSNQYIQTYGIKYCSKIKEVTYTGHLYDGRGIDILIELARNYQNIQFNIYGGDKELIEHYNKMNLLNNLKFHGHVPYSEIQKILYESDVLIAPYKSKVYLSNGMDTSGYMSPLKLFEYMAAGKPIITSNLPSVREVLIDGRTALLCEPSRIESWIKALQLISENGDLRSRLQKNALENFNFHHSWENRAKIMSRLFEVEEKRHG